MYVLRDRPQQLRIDSNTKSLRTLRQWLAKQAQAAGFDEVSTEEFILASDEAYSNVVEHAYPDRDDGLVEVIWQAAADRAIITFRDCGVEFSPAACTEPDLVQSVKARKGGGHGIKLMRLMMDAVEFSRRDEVNELRMTKRLV